jgi:hypothetical protein
MGTNVITAGSIGVYVGGNIVACNWDGDTDYGDTDDMAVPISANGIEQCDWQTATCAAGTEVKVTSPSGVQTTDNC